MYEPGGGPDNNFLSAFGLGGAEFALSLEIQFPQPLTGDGGAVFIHLSRPASRSSRSRRSRSDS